jgi:hypothetical protein
MVTSDSAWLLCIDQCRGGQNPRPAKNPEIRWVITARGWVKSGLRVYFSVSNGYKQSGPDLEIYPVETEPTRDSR